MAIIIYLIFLYQFVWIWILSLKNSVQFCLDGCSIIRIVTELTQWLSHSNILLYRQPKTILMKNIIAVLLSNEKWAYIKYGGYNLGFCKYSWILFFISSYCYNIYIIHIFFICIRFYLPDIGMFSYKQTRIISPFRNISNC